MVYRDFPDSQTMPGMQKKPEFEVYSSFDGNHGGMRHWFELYGCAK